MATNPRQAEHESRPTAHETTRKVAEEAAQASRTVADAADRTMRAGAEAVRRNADRLGGTWRSGSEAANRIVERSFDQIGQLFGLTGDTARQTVRQTSGNMRALVDSTTIMVGGLQDVAAEWMRFAQSRMEQNLDHFDRLLECRSLPQHLALQTQIVRDHLEAFLHSARLTSERSTQIADEAVRSVSESSLAPE
jgi:hypothetical protein